MTRCDSPRLQSRGFCAQANLLLAGLLGRRDSFFKKMEEFYDRTGREECHLSDVFWAYAANRAGLDDQLRGLGDGHEKPLHVGMGDRAAACLRRSNRNLAFLDKTVERFFVKVPLVGQVGSNPY